MEPKQHWKVVEVIDDPGVNSAIAAVTNSLNAYGAHVVVLAAIGGVGRKAETDEIVEGEK